MDYFQIISDIVSDISSESLDIMDSSVDNVESSEGAPGSFVNEPPLAPAPVQVPAIARPLSGALNADAAAPVTGARAPHLLPPATSADQLTAPLATSGFGFVQPYQDFGDGRGATYGAPPSAGVQAPTPTSSNAAAWLSYRADSAAQYPAPAHDWRPATTSTATPAMTPWGTPSASPHGPPAAGWHPFPTNTTFGWDFGQYHCTPEGIIAQQRAVLENALANLVSRLCI